jgi:hypothetical protein
MGRDVALLLQPAPVAVVVAGKRVTISTIKEVAGFVLNEANNWITRFAELRITILG